MLVKIHILSLNKINKKMSSAEWQTFCLGLNVLIAMTCNPTEIYIYVCVFVYVCV